MKSQVLHTVWCHISCEAAGEFWHWSLSGVKGLKNRALLTGRRTLLRMFIGMCTCLFPRLPSLFLSSPSLVLTVYCCATLLSFPLALCRYQFHYSNLPLSFFNPPHLFYLFSYLLTVPFCPCRLALVRDGWLETSHVLLEGNWLQSTPQWNSYWGLGESAVTEGLLKEHDKSPWSELHDVDGYFKSRSRKNHSGFQKKSPCW